MPARAVGVGGGRAEHHRPREPRRPLVGRAQHLRRHPRRLLQRPAHQVRLVADLDRVHERAARVAGPGVEPRQLELARAGHPRPAHVGGGPAPVARAHVRHEPAERRLGPGLARQPLRHVVARRRLELRVGGQAGGPHGRVVLEAEHHLHAVGVGGRHLLVGHAQPVARRAGHAGVQLVPIRQILDECRTIAVVGLSSSPMRASNGVSRYMRENGYKVIPVNPNEEQVFGEKSFANLLTFQKK